MCIGVYAMMVDLIGQIHEARQAQLKEDPDATIGPVLMVAACEGSVCAMSQREEQWQELRSRTDLYTNDDLAPVVDIIRPLAENAGSDVHVVFMADDQGSQFAQVMSEQMPNIRVIDVSVQNQFWNILTDLYPMKKTICHDLKTDRNDVLPQLPAVLVVQPTHFGQCPGPVESWRRPNRHHRHHAIQHQLATMARAGGHHIRHRPRHPVGVSVDCPRPLDQTGDR